MSKQTERIEGSLLTPDINESLEKKRTRATIEQALAMSRVADTADKLIGPLSLINWVQVCLDLSKILKGTLVIKCWWSRSCYYHQTKALQKINNENINGRIGLKKGAPMLDLMHEIGHAVNSDQINYEARYRVVFEKGGALEDRRSVIKCEAGAWRWVKRNIGRDLTLVDRKYILKCYGSHLVGANWWSRDERNQQDNQASP